MGKTTGFLEFERAESTTEAPLSRIRHFGEFHTPLSAAVRQKQGGRCMDCGVPFCQTGSGFGGQVYGCPLHNLIPEWNDMIWSGNPAHALSRLLKTDNFPEFTGRVCPALCEQACTCAIRSTPVTIRENELGIIEDAFAGERMAPRVPEARSDKRIAVIGSGPAGLACADQLNHRGHHVTVFERDDRVGGLLMYGIPNMKLPKEVVRRRTDLMALEGIEFRVNANIASKEAAEKLLETYDAVVLCCGATKPRPYAPLEQAKSGAAFAVDYLTAATRAVLNPAAENPLSAKDRDVVVVGAGFTSSDCVATALRQGCRSLVQIIRKPETLVRPGDGLWGTWRAAPDYAEEEARACFGEDIRRFETIVKESVVDEAGALTGVKTARVAWKQAGGKLRMDEIPGTEETLPCDLLLVASGFSGCETEVCDAFGVKADRRGNLCAEDGDTHHTANEKVFAAGDMRRGASLVVWAIAEGRAAAREVDEYLMGYTSL